MFSRCPRILFLPGGFGWYQLGIIYILVLFYSLVWSSAALSFLESRGGYTLGEGRSTPVQIAISLKGLMCGFGTLLKVISAMF